jgi:ABC-type nitrate/sulfonate/bicarbonate transport system permease component
MFKKLPLRTDVKPGTARVLAASFVVLLIFFWFLLTLGSPERRIISAATLPAPLEVLQSVPSLIQDRGLFAAIGASMSRVLGGFLLAALIAVPLGIFAASQRWLDAFLRPLVVGLRNIPVAALIPITLLWFGIGEQQKVMFIFIASFPFIFSDSVAAVMNVPERYVDTARTLGASESQIIRNVLLPLAAPAIFQSLRALFGLAFGYIMLAEVINTQTGLGALINTSQRLGKTEHVYLTLIVIGLIAFLVDWALSRLDIVIFPYKQR